MMVARNILSEGSRTAGATRTTIAPAASAPLASAIAASVLLASALLCGAGCTKAGADAQEAENAHPSDGRTAYISVVTDCEDATRGPVSTTTGMNTDGNTFLMHGLLEEANRPEGYTNDNPHYINGKPFTYNATAGLWTSTCVWTNDVFSNLWAVYPAYGAKVIDEHRRITISFENDGKSITDRQQKTCLVRFRSAVNTSKSYAADSLRDYVFAYARKKGKVDTDENTDTSVTLKFKHVLSAVCFVPGTSTQMGDDDISIDTIKLSCLYTSGLCTLVAQPSEYGDNQGDDFTFSWSDLSGTDVTMVQAVDPESEFLTSNPSASALGYDGKKLFNLIPQTTPSGTKITVKFWSKEGLVPQSFREVSLDFSGQIWEPGYKYTYTITYQGHRMVVQLSSVQAWEEGASSTFDTKRGSTL